VLLLDEPTNHLSVPLVEELGRAILTTPAAVVLVTHDRAPLAEVGILRAPPAASRAVASWLRSVAAAYARRSWSRLPPRCWVISEPRCWVSI
jgi:ATPase subunit of ABC transporter with duplicated ATPase domains